MRQILKSVVAVLPTAAAVIVGVTATADTVLYTYLKEFKTVKIRFSKIDHVFLILLTPPQQRTAALTALFSRSCLVFEPTQLCWVLLKS